MEFLRVANLSHLISDEYTLKDISFLQGKYENLVIAGETGSGKSTLLRIIAGLAQPQTGNVFFHGLRVDGPEERLVPGHPGIAYLSQHFELPKFLRVEQILSYANSLSDAKAETIFEVCQIDDLLSRKTDQLSGGERQRIALARLLIGSPQLLLLDEPFSNLDLVHKNTLKDVIERIATELGITLILVSHDPGDTLPWAERILVMRRGHIVQSGSPSVIYHQPIDEYVAGLFGKFNTLNKELQHRFGVNSGTVSKAMYARPEQIRIAGRGEGVAGVVESCNFYGSYFEIIVAIQDHRLNVRSTTSAKQGDTVGLQLNALKSFPQV